MTHPLHSPEAKPARGQWSAHTFPLKRFEWLIAAAALPVLSDVAVKTRLDVNTGLARAMCAAVRKAEAQGLSALPLERCPDGRTEQATRDAAMVAFARAPKMSKQEIMHNFKVGLAMAGRLERAWRNAHNPGWTVAAPFRPGQGMPEGLKQTMPTKGRNR